MEISLIAFLTNAAVGHLRLGDTREDVIESLGEPPWWYGQGKLAAKDSDVWQYRTLQINFNSASAVETYRLHFRYEITAGNAKLELNSSPIRILETIGDEVAEICGFEKFLVDHNVPYICSKNSNGQRTIICNETSTATFRTITDHDASIAAERRIVVPGQRIMNAAVGIIC